jgi:hypothetical protein
MSVDLSNRFERGLSPRNSWGRFGRGAKPPSEEKIQRFKLRQKESA